MIKLKSIIIILILALTIIPHTLCVRLSNGWSRFLKIVNTNDPTNEAKAVFKFSDNVMVYLGCNVYECSYFKSGYTFHLQNQGLCKQKTQLYCQDSTIDLKYLNILRDAAEVREEYSEIKFFDKN